MTIRFTTGLVESDMLGLMTRGLARKMSPAATASGTTKADAEAAEQDAANADDEAYRAKMASLRQRDEAARAELQKIERLQLELDALGGDAVAKARLAVRRASGGT